MMLCYCVLHVFRHFLHWNCCVEGMWSHLQLFKFQSSLARKLRFHIFNLRIWRKHRTKASFLYIMDVIWMLVFARNIVFFRVNRASGAVKSRLACATGADVVGRGSKCARAVELMVHRDFFFSLMMLCYCVLHVFKHYLHWNCCVKDMWSQGSLARKLRFHIFNLFEFDGSIARKLRFLTSALKVCVLE